MKNVSTKNTKPKKNKSLNTTFFFEQSKVKKQMTENSYHKINERKLQLLQFLFKIGIHVNVAIPAFRYSLFAKNGIG